MNPCLVFLIIVPIFFNRSFGNRQTNINLRKKITNNWVMDANENINMEFDNRLWVRSGIHGPDFIGTEVKGCSANYEILFPVDRQSEQPDLNLTWAHRLWTIKPIN